MTGVAAMAVVLSLSNMTVLAAEQAQVYDASNGGCAYCGASCEFVDADGDGICDNYVSRNYCGRGYGRRHGRGRHCR